MKKAIVSLVALVAVAFPGNAAERRGKSLGPKTKDGLAIQGYDPVAYFTDNKAVKGTAKFSSEYDGAKYLFATAEHKRLFDREPVKFAPTYGGYCGYAA